MAQHVSVHWKVEAGSNTKPLDHLAEATRGERRATLRDKDKRGCRILFPLEAAQHPQLTSGEWMRSRLAVLDAGDVQFAAIKVDTLPAQPRRLRRAQPMPKCDQDHGRVAVPMPVAGSGLDQALDLPLGQVFT